ncbi:hypothetical protein [Nocardioides sp. URHA0020]|uniref:hypothetical protein n=1 Tax=Nocardioides sp. URHA0020 TaxID=1380392 RepID=UPI0012DCC446|nr:hypothetical protein [Nocardioides sp. URHA0020]
MASRVDIEGLLSLGAVLGGGPLPFVVRPPRGLTAREMLADVRTAAAVADALACERVPADPTSATEADATSRGVVAELAEGTMAEEEVRAWFADLIAALDAVGVSARVEPRPPSKRLPDLYPWLSMPPPVTAFLHFASDQERDGLPVISDDVLREILPHLASWVHVAAGMTVVETGLTDTVSTAARAADELLSVLPVDPQQLGVSCIALEPRRQRYARVDLNATGALQALDETSSLTTDLAAVCEALNIVGPYLDYAAVRRAQPTTGSYGDAVDCLGRDLSPGEQVVHDGRAHGILDRYVVDAWVAQVLTERHLDEVGAPDGFDVTELGNRRYLVVAADPEPWLTGTNPEPSVWENARTWLAPVLLTPGIHL